jgi:hypothetical protein
MKRQFKFEELENAPERHHVATAEDIEKINKYLLEEYGDEDDQVLPGSEGLTLEEISKQNHGFEEEELQHLICVVFDYDGIY